MRVMGFGTFDGIHPGHEDFFRQLQELGDEVFVVIARDENVKKIKGRAPRHNEKARFSAVQSSGLVDRVIPGDAQDFYRCLRDHKPDVIGLGYDQKANEAAIKKILPKVRIVRLLAFEPEKYKSSLLF